MVSGVRAGIEDALGQVRPRLTAYVPHTPTPKQRAFLWLPHKEAFYGGAAGGGKSDALLMGALQYVDIPKFSALILRKTLTDADKPGSILARARDWLGATDAVLRGHCWFFPSGAKIQFGKLHQTGDRESYQSDEYQYIAGDEITHFREHDFDYVTSRLRRSECPHHKEKKYPDSCRSCAEYGALMSVPLRVRTASNPGGVGHIWVKYRYDIRRVKGGKTPNGRPLYAGHNKEKPHIPAFIEDNPFLGEDYRETLKSMKDPVTREQLLSGDWGVSREGRFKMGWRRYYQSNGPYIELRNVGTYRERQLETFIIIDPAASVNNTPGTLELTKKIASYTAVGVFSFTPCGNTLLRRMQRHQKEAPDIKYLLDQMLERFPDVQFVGMELTAMSTHLYQMLSRAGYPMKAFKPKGNDKIARSVTAQNEMEMGRYWFPETDERWLMEYEDELFLWTGDKDEQDDQVDVTSYAAIYKRQRLINNLGVAEAADLPSMI